MDRSAPEHPTLWCCGADTCALKRQKNRTKNRIERGGQTVSQEEGNRTQSRKWATDLSEMQMGEEVKGVQEAKCDKLVVSEFREE